MKSDVCVDFFFQSLKVQQPPNVASSHPYKRKAAFTYSRLLISLHPLSLIKRECCASPHPQIVEVGFPLVIGFIWRCGKVWPKRQGSGSYSILEIGRMLSSKTPELVGGFGLKQHGPDLLVDFCHRSLYHAVHRMFVWWRRFQLNPLFLEVALKLGSKFSLSIVSSYKHNLCLGLSFSLRFDLSKCGNHSCC